MNKEQNNNRKSKWLKPALVVICVLALISTIFFKLNVVKAASYTSTQSGNWSDIATWGGVGPPGTGDTVTVSAGHTVTLTASATAGTVTIASTGILALGSSGYVLTLDGAVATPLTVTGTLTPGTNSTVKYTSVNAGGNVNIAATTYNSLQFTPGSAESYDMTGSLTTTNAMTGSLTINANATVNTYVGTTSYDISAVNLTINAYGKLDAGVNGSAGTSTITLSGNWLIEYLHGLIDYGMSTVILTESGTLGSSDDKNKGFYNLNCAADGKVTTLAGAYNLASVNHVLTLGTGTLTTGTMNINGTGNALVPSTATINSTIRFMIVGSVNIPTHTYGGGLVIGGNTSQITGDIVTTSLQLLPIVTDQAQTVNTNNYSITATSLSIGSTGDTKTNAYNFGSSAVTINGSVTINTHGTGGSHTVNANTSVWSVSGNWTNNDTFTAGSSTVNFTKATGTQTLNSGGVAAANQFNNLTHSGAGTLQLITNDLKMSGNFINSAGTFDTNTKNIQVGGNVNLTTGSYTQGTTTMTLNGAAAQSFTAGGTGVGHTPYNLTVTNASASGVTFADSLTLATGGTFTDSTGDSHLTFNAGSTYTVPTLTMNGTSGHKIVLRSSSATNYWNLNVTNAPTVSYVDVSDSDATGATITADNNSTNSGHNLNWTFNYDTISGSLYDAIGGSKITAVKTIKVSVNGGAVDSGTTSSGDYTITLASNLNANDIVTVFISGDIVKASTVTKVNNIGPLTGINLFQNYTTTRNETGISQLTNTDLATADNLADIDILFSVGGGNAVTFTQGVYIPATFTYNPMGDITTLGNWNGTGTFTASSYQVVFSGAGTQTLNSGGTGTGHLYNGLTHDGAGTLQLLTNNLDVDGNFVNSAGTFDTNGKDILAASNVDLTTGTLTQGTRTITLDGAAAQSFTAGGTGAGHTPYNLTVTNASASGVTFADSLTLASGGTFTDSTGDSHLTFNAGSTYTVPTLTMNGTVGHNITLRSSSPGTYWNLNVSNAPTLSYIDAQDSDAHTGSAILADMSIDSLHNVNWIFTFGAQVKNLTNNGASIGQYNQFELTFDVNFSTATNFYWPYDTNPAVSIPAGAGITVNGQFSNDNWATTLTVPGFYFQDYTRSLVTGDGSNYNDEAIVPTGTPHWKIRFAPPALGNWKYKISVTDANGTNVNAENSFTAIASDNHGFVKTSSTDSRYFELSDGTTLLSPALELQPHSTYEADTLLDTYNTNGMKVARWWADYREWQAAPFGGGVPSTMPMWGFTTGSINNGGGAKSGDRYSISQSAGNDTRQSLWLTAGTLYRFTGSIKTSSVTGSAGQGVIAYIGTQQATAVTGTQDWTTFSVNFTPSSTASYNIGVKHTGSGGTGYFDDVSVKFSTDGGATWSGEYLAKGDADYENYVDQREAWKADYIFDEAEQKGVYLETVVSEKQDESLGRIQSNGTTGARSDDNFYGSATHPSRWLQQAYWRYFAGRWGAYTSLHSTELANETDPFSGNAYNAANALADYVHNNYPAERRILSTTSFWHSIPMEFWKTSSADYINVHEYIGPNTTSCDSHGPRFYAWYDPTTCAGTGTGTLVPTADTTWGYTDFDTGIYHSGTKSEKIIGHDGAVDFNSNFTPGAGEYHIGIDPTHTYTLRYWAKGQNINNMGGGGAWTRPGADITWSKTYHENDYVSEMGVDASLGTYDWTQYQNTNIVPAATSNTANILFRSTRGTAGQGDGTFWVDDVEFIDNTTGQSLYLDGGFENARIDYDTALAVKKIGMLLDSYGVRVSKPVVWGETGIRGDNVYGSPYKGYSYTGENQQLVDDTNGIYIKKMIWAHLGPDNPNMQMWWQDNIIQKNLYSYFKVFQNFIADVSLSNGKYIDAAATTSNANLRAWGQKEKDPLDSNRASQTLLWIDNTPYNWKNIVDGNIPAAVSGTVTVPNMKNGQYTAQWYNTSTGAISSTEYAMASGNTLTLSVSNMVSDTAVKVTLDVPTAPTAPTIGTPQVLSNASIRWNFTDNANNETGFKIYDGSDNLVATCASANIAYCDETGLSVNVQYAGRYVVAYNATGDSARSGTAASTYTLANAPAAPTVNYNTDSSLTIIINANSNSATTQFAIQNVTANKWVKADGSLGDSEVWQTRASWGGDAGVANSGLSANTIYSYQVKARNGDNTETALSDSAQKVTGASSPGTATVTVLSPGSIQIDWTSGGGQNKFNIYRNGQSGIGTLIHSASDLTYTDTGLNPATIYSYYIYSVNDDGVESSDFVSATVSTPAEPSTNPTSIPSTATNNPQTSIGQDYTSPVASFEITPDPSNLIVDQSISFDATQSSDNIGITRYEWDFGDGETANSVQVDHRYQKPGQYIVKLTVFDKDGNKAEKTQTVNIKPTVPTISNIYARGEDIIVEGKAFPETLVYLTFNSNNIDGEVTVDKSGNWQYTLAKAIDVLGEGDHTVFGIPAVKLANGSEIRGDQSKTYDFKVTLDNGKLKVEMLKTKIWQLVSLGLILVLVAGFFVLRRRRR